MTFREYIKHQKVSKRTNISLTTRLELSETLRDLNGIELFQSLKHIVLDGSNIIDYEPLSLLKDLKSLVIHNFNPISNIYKQPFLDKITYFKCEDCDLEEVPFMKNLEILLISNTKIKNLDTIIPLKNIQELNCSYTDLENLNGIENLKNLKSLNCEMCLLNNILGTEYLDLREFHFDGNPLLYEKYNDVLLSENTLLYRDILLLTKNITKSLVRKEKIKNIFNESL